jgi:hypothetical protein
MFSLDAVVSKPLMIIFPKLFLNSAVGESKYSGRLDALTGEPISISRFGEETEFYNYMQLILNKQKKYEHILTLILYGHILYCLVL